MQWKSNSRNSADLERISEKDILVESHSISAHDKIIEQFSASNIETKNDNTEADTSFHSGQSSNACLKDIPWSVCSIPYAAKSYKLKWFAGGEI